MKNAKPGGQISRRLFWLASLMFFLSGGTGLAYQVIWFKRFAHVWGSSSLAFASVGGSFLFGLGVGAYLFGRFTDRIQRPLRAYGMCELAIGLVALWIPFEIQWLIQLSAGFYSQLPEDPLLRYVLQFCVTLLVVGPPCVLMGGTLPLLIRELTARDGALDQATGWLYAINTFGAAAGCYLAGFQLLPTVGLASTNNLAAGLNISIGFAALLLSRRAPGRRGQQKAAPAEPAATGGGLRLAVLYLAVALAGLGALILEMTWSRQLALVLGGSSYAYSATLFVVLVGIALGSLIFHLGLRRVALSPWLPIVVIGALAVGCLAGKSLLPWLSAAVGDHRESRESLLGNAAVCVAASALLELLPAAAMGILFPLFVDLTRRHASRVGRTVGDVYAWNTFGSIIGASLTAVVLFPRIGTAGSVALATALYVISLLLVLPLRSARDMVRAGVCLAAGTGLVAGILIPQSPLLTNMGLYRIGTDAVDLTNLKQLYFAEGASCNVLVTSENGTSLRVNGKVDASDEGDMVTQVGLACLPRLFCHDARSVLVIGFGSGTTPGVSLLFPDTRVTCCEIEPAVFEAAPFFAHINHRPYEKTRQFLAGRNAGLPVPEQLTDDQIDEQARLTMVFGDGRTLLQGASRTYDMIISEPSNPWLAGVSNLYTQEFFQAAKAHLSRGGVLAQWIQVYNFSLSDYLMIVRTMRSVFPHCGLVSLGRGDSVLLASDEPLLPSPTELEDLQKVVDESPELLADVGKWFATTDLKLILLSHYTIDQEALDALVKRDRSQQLNTDINMRLEFNAPLNLFQQLSHSESAFQLTGLSEPGWMARLGAILGIAPDSADYQMALGLQTFLIEQRGTGVEHLRKAIAIDPQKTAAYRTLVWMLRIQRKPQEVLATLRAWVKACPEDSVARRVLFKECVATGDHEAAVEAAEPLVTLESTDAQAHALLADELLKINRAADAAAHFRRALELDPKVTGNPTKPVWVNNYAWLLATHPDSTVRNGDEALRWAKEACEAVNYEAWGMVDTLAAAYAETGQFDEAVKYMQQIIDRARANGETQVAELAEAHLKLYQSRQPYREK